MEQMIFKGMVQFKQIVLMHSNGWKEVGQVVIMRAT
jgi:hypothetical protein